MHLRVLLAALIVVSTSAFVVGTTLERSNKHEESPEHLAAERAAPSQPEPTTATTAKTTPERKAKRASSKTTSATKTTDEHAGESAAHRAAEGLPPETTTATKTKTAQARKPETSREPSGSHVEGKGGESPAAHAAEGGHSETHAELKPLGIDIEAVPFVALAALVSLGLAVAAWLRPRWVLLLLVIVVTMLAFALLDVREVFHQSDESQTGLAVLAAVIAALHLAAAAVAGLMGRQARRPAADFETTLPSAVE
jgi:hypothetical protein